MLCKDAPESIKYITAGCKMQAGMANIECHNQVASTVNRNICAEFRLEVPASKWKRPQKVDENDELRSCGT